MSGLFFLSRILAQTAPSAPASLANSATTARQLTTYQFERLEQSDDPRLLIGLIAVAAALYVAFVVWQYWREHASLPRGAALLLSALRIVALAGAIVFFLKPVKRTDRETIADSQVTVLVDVSQSMAVEDESFEGLGKATRARAVAELFAKTPLLDQWRTQHQVNVRTFDANTRRIAEWVRNDTDNSDPNRVEASPAAGKSDQQAKTENASKLDPQNLDWSKLLTPQGTKTSLGDALSEALADSADGPLAGVIVISDGLANTGLDPQTVAAAAAEARVPIYTVGVGSTKSRRNFRVQDLLAPSRAYPEDKTKIRAVIAAEGFRGRSAAVSLYARVGEEETPFTQIGEQQLQIDADEQVETLEFEIEPTEVGRMEVEVRIDAPTDDQYASDNRRTVELEIVETSTRVLLVASGATREFRFLRNQLQRDRHTTVDVLLQLSEPGISQDADDILKAFPTDKKTLYEYDCIVAFDPDWTLLDAQQVELLEGWVAEQAGGMIVVAGPVHTAAWVQSAEHAKIRGLYPVEFQPRLTFLDDGIFGSTTPWPLAFTRAGEESEFLMLADSPADSEAAWARFPGVFGCYAVKGPKPGATVYARYSDPDASITAELPVYLAEHFYGAGRVFYFGSGEMWRLRGVDPGYFEVLYTQLIRHVAQGRLQRGSAHGMLLVGRDRYSVGDDVTIRAQLRTAAQEPYVAEQISLRATGPSGDGETIVLNADPQRPGNYLGQISVTKEGSYRLELPVPDEVDEQLVRRFQAVLPDLEFEQTQRNSELLAYLAETTGGDYYRSLNQVVSGVGSLRPLGGVIESRAEIEIIPGQPEKSYTESIHKSLLAIICGALFLEWFFRRLMKLA